MQAEQSGATGARTVTLTACTFGTSRSSSSGRRGGEPSRREVQRVVVLTIPRGAHVWDDCKHAQADRRESGKDGSRLRYGDWCPLVVPQIATCALNIFLGHPGRKALGCARTSSLGNVVLRAVCARVRAQGVQGAGAAGQNRAGRRTAPVAESYLELERSAYQAVPRHE